MNHSAAPRKWSHPTRLVLCLFVVYVMWGTTYPAIRLTLVPPTGTGIPVYVATGGRLLCAGLVVLILAQMTRNGRATTRHLTAKQIATAVGAGAFLSFGTGLLVGLAALRIPSGVLAILMATAPVWAVLMTAATSRRRPSNAVIVGLFLGLLGVISLSDDTVLRDLRGVMYALAGAILWAFGSWYTTHLRSFPDHILTTAGIAQVTSGLGLLALGVLRGGTSELAHTNISGASMIAMAYLVLVSLTGFTAYTWLLRHTTPVVATTHAFANPLVAAFVGALLLDEQLSPRLLICAALVGSGAFLAVRSSAGSVERRRQRHAELSPDRATCPPPRSGDDEPDYLLIGASRALQEPVPLIKLDVPEERQTEMWVLQQPGPGVFNMMEVDPPKQAALEPGELLLRFGAGAICGSDIPKFVGIMDADNPYTGLPGVPMHELVGYVEASRSDRFSPGDRAVGMVPQSNGLTEQVIIPAEYMVKIDDHLGDVDATMVQPLASVLNALDNVPDVNGKAVAVLGLGPLGVLFTHVLKARGAKRVIGVDRIDRSDVADDFGIDEVVHGTVRDWANNLPEDAKPALVVDAIGHRQEIVQDAVTALSVGGHVVIFGLPEDQYVFPMRSFFRKNLTMSGGATQDWIKFLALAQNYVLADPTLPQSYIRNVFPVAEAEAAYRMYSMPTCGRLKVALTSGD